MTQPGMLLPFMKGHGTGNDFVLIDDREAQWDMSPAQVRALCDRHRGIGADGLIRLVPVEAMSAEAVPTEAASGNTVPTEVVPSDAVLADTAPNQSPARWMMDYRNADGTLAQMCGNGVRVFAAFAEHLGLVDFEDTPYFPVATRSGVKYVRKEDVHVDGRSHAWFAVDMGQWTVSARPDAQVHVRGAGSFPGTSANLGNPHTVVHVPDAHTLAALDLTQMPQVDPLPAQGTNVEFVAVTSLTERGCVPSEGQAPSQTDVPFDAMSLVDAKRPADADADAVAGPGLGLEAGAGTAPEAVTVARIAMRVYERGVGETQSCGTGCCAAALVTAAQLHSGPALTDPGKSSLVQSTQVQPGLTPLNSARSAPTGPPHSGPVPSPADEPDVWMVDIPGGCVRVRKLPGHKVELAGPAQLTFSGSIDIGRLTASQA